MSLFPNLDDIVDALGPLAAANKVQQQLVTKAWERLVSAIPADTVIAAMQQTHFAVPNANTAKGARIDPNASGSSAPNSGGGGGSAPPILTSAVLKRFATECDKFSFVAITAFTNGGMVAGGGIGEELVSVDDVGGTDAISGASPAAGATLTSPRHPSVGGRATAPSSPKPQHRQPAAAKEFVLAMPSHEQLYYLRVILSCCVPREDSISACASVYPVVAKVAMAVVEVLMGLLQLRLPPMVAEDIRSVLKEERHEGTYKLFLRCSGGEGAVLGGSTSSAGITGQAITGQASASLTTPPPQQSSGGGQQQQQQGGGQHMGIPTTLVELKAHTIAALQALEVLQLPVGMWREPKGVRESDMGVARNTGGFLGKWFKGGGGAAAEAANPSASTADEPIVKLSHFISHWGFLMADVGARHNTNAGTSTIRGGSVSAETVVASNIADYLAMTLSLRVVPLVLLGMAPPANVTPTITVGGMTGNGMGSPQQAAMQGYGNNSVTSTNTPQQGGSVMSPVGNNASTTASPQGGGASSGNDGSAPMGSPQAAPSSTSVMVGYGPAQVQPIALLAQVIASVCCGLAPAYAVAGAFSSNSMRAAPSQYELSTISTHTLCSTATVCSVSGQRVLSGHPYSFTIVPACFSAKLLASVASSVTASGKRSTSSGGGITPDALCVYDQTQSPELRVSDVVAASALVALSLLQATCVVPVQVMVTPSVGVNMAASPGQMSQGAAGGQQRAVGASLGSDVGSGVSSPLGMMGGSTTATFIVGSNPPPAVAVALSAVQSALAAPSPYLRSVVNIVNPLGDATAMGGAGPSAGSILITPTPTTPSAGLAELLGKWSATNDQQEAMRLYAAYAQLKATEVRTNLLFLIAMVTHNLTTKEASTAVEEFVEFLRQSLTSAPTSRTRSFSDGDTAIANWIAQQLLDGFRSVYTNAVRMLAMHGAARGLLTTRSFEQPSSYNYGGGYAGNTDAEGDVNDDPATRMAKALAATRPGALANRNLHTDANTRGVTTVGGATTVAGGAFALGGGGVGDAAALELDEDVVAVEFQSAMLQSVLSIFVNCGPSVRSEQLTVLSVKRLVFPMLLETSLRREGAIHRASFSLYLAVRRDFRGSYTVSENGSFYKHVIFFLLESKHVRVAHKRLVLQVLMKVAEEPRDLVEIFLNYDCDRNSSNVFETLMGILGNYTCGVDKPSLPSLNAPTSVRFGFGGVAPLVDTTKKTTPPTPAASAGEGEDGQLTITTTDLITTSLPPFPPVGLPPNRHTQDSLYEDALAVVLLLPNAVRQWIERFEDAIKAREADEARARRKRLGGGKKASRAANSGIDVLVGIDEADEHSSVSPSLLTGGPSSSAAAGTNNKNAPPTNTTSAFLEHHRTKRLLRLFFELFNAQEKPNEAIAMITSGRIPLDVVEAEIRVAAEANRAELSGYVLLEKLLTPEELVVVGDSPSSDSAKGDVTSPNPRAPDAKAAPPSPPQQQQQPANKSRLVARFLHAHCDAIDKVVLGEYFSKMGRKEDIKRVFNEWVSLHDFVKMKPIAPSVVEGGPPSEYPLVDPSTITCDDVALPIDEALRVFLGGFKLLGEAQVVDRTMELFASYYCDSVRAAVDRVEQQWATHVAEQQPPTVGNPTDEATSPKTDDRAPPAATGGSDPLAPPHLLGTSPEGNELLSGQLASMTDTAAALATAAVASVASPTGTVSEGTLPAALAGSGDEVPTAAKHPLLAESQLRTTAEGTSPQKGAGGDGFDAASSSADGASDGSSRTPAVGPIAADGDKQEAAASSTTTPEKKAEAASTTTTAQHQQQQEPHRIYVLNQNTAFILAFSICMLNTDAHSAHVKEKMGQQQFVRNNAGIDDGKDVPSDLLGAVYQRVSSNEIVLRPTRKLPANSPQMAAQLAKNTSTTQPTKGFNVFNDAIVAPLGFVFGAIKLPFDVAGDLVFNTTAIEKQRRKEKESRQEMQAALTAALGQLRTIGGGGGGVGMGIGANNGAANTQPEAGLEHAIPMWEACADLVVTSLAMALTDVCSPSDNDTEHTDSAHAQWLLQATQDCFAVCVTFGFHEHVSIIASLLKELSLVGDVVDPSRPLAPSPTTVARSTATANKSSSAANANTARHRGCVVSRPIAMKNLRCAYALLDCVNAHRRRVTSVAVWRHCYLLLSRIELINDLNFWAAAEEEVAANAQVLSNANKDASWMGRWRSDVAKAASVVTLGVLPNDTRSTMLDVSVKTVAGITDPIARSLTVRNAIRRAIGRISAEAAVIKLGLGAGGVGHNNNTAAESAAKLAAAGNVDTDVTATHPAFYTFDVPSDDDEEGLSSSSDEEDAGNGGGAAGRRKKKYAVGSDDDDDDATSRGAKVSFTQQAAMIIALSRETCEEITNEGRTHLLVRLTALLTESMVISPRLQWNELWKRVASTVIVVGGTHPSARVATGVLQSALHPIALRFFHHSYERDEVRGVSSSPAERDSPSVGKGDGSDTPQRGSSRQRDRSAGINTVNTTTTSSMNRNSNALFQNEVLKPFETLLVTNRDVAVQLTVVECIASLVADAHYALSPSTGWPIIFNVLNKASAMAPPLIAAAWRVFRSILQQYPLDALCIVNTGDVVRMGQHHTTTNTTTGGIPDSSITKEASMGMVPNASMCGNATDGPTSGNSNSTSASKLFDLQVFESGIIYTLTSFACQSDETVACEALLWLETCADAAQHGLAVFTRTTQSPDGRPSTGGVTTAGPAVNIAVGGSANPPAGAAPPQGDAKGTTTTTTSPPIGPTTATTSSITTAHRHIAHRHVRTFSAGGTGGMLGGIDMAQLAEHAAKAAATTVVGEDGATATTEGEGARSRSPSLGAKAGNSTTAAISIDLLLYVPMAPLSAATPLQLRPVNALPGGTAPPSATNRQKSTTMAGNDGALSSPQHKQQRGINDDFDGVNLSATGYYNLRGGGSFADASRGNTATPPAAAAEDAPPTSPADQYIAAAKAAIATLSAIAAHNPRIRNVWQCLLECIAPIITIHTSLKVRCVAISCFFSVLSKYGHYMDGLQVWDSVIWEACRSALLGHILSQSTTRRTIRLAAADGKGGGDDGSAPTGSDEASGVDVPWSDILSFLFIREAVCATIECEGRLVRESAGAVGITATPTSSSSAANTSSSSSHLSFYTHQRARIGRWRNRLLSVVADKALTDVRLLRSPADPFAAVAAEQGSAADGSSSGGGGGRSISSGCSPMADTITHIICSLLLPAYAEGKASGVAATIIETLLRKGGVSEAAGDDGADGTSTSNSNAVGQFLAANRALHTKRVLMGMLVNRFDAFVDGTAYVVGKLQQDDVALMGAVPPTASKNGATTAAAAASSSPQSILTALADKRFQSALHRPPLVEVFLRQFLSTVLPDAFRRMQDVSPLSRLHLLVMREQALAESAMRNGVGGGKSAASAAASLAAMLTTGRIDIPTFVGPAASHSRSSFLSKAGDARMKALLIPSAVGNAAAQQSAAAVVGAGAATTTQQKPSGPPPKPNQPTATATATGGQQQQESTTTAPPQPAHHTAIPTSTLPFLLGLPHYATLVTDVTLMGALRVPTGGRKAAAGSDNEAVKALMAAIAANSKAAAASADGNDFASTARSGKFPPPTSGSPLGASASADAHAANTAATIGTLLTRLLNAPVGSSYYKPPPRVAPLASVVESAAIVAGDDNNSVGIITSPTTSKQTTYVSLAATRSDLAVASSKTTAEVWRDLMARVLLTGLWKPFWNTAGAVFVAAFPMPPLSNGATAANPRCMHCRCDCHGRSSHNLTCLPLPSVGATPVSPSAAAAANGSAARSRCCCPCVLSHHDSGYVYTGLTILATMEQCLVNSAGMGGRIGGGGAVVSSSPAVLCRHTLPSPDVALAVRYVCSAFVGAAERALGVATATASSAAASAGNAATNASGLPSASEAVTAANNITALAAPIADVVTATPPQIVALSSTFADLTRKVMGDALQMSRSAVGGGGSGASDALESLMSPTLGGATAADSSSAATGNATTDTLPTLPPGSSVVVGALWSLAVHHRIGLASATNAAVPPPPPEGDASSSGTTPPTAAAATLSSQQAMVTALANDLLLCTEHIRALSRWVLAHIITTAAPPPSATTVTATARAAEEALIKRTSVALANALYDTQAAGADTVFGLWSVGHLQQQQVQASNNAMMGSDTDNTAELLAMKRLAIRNRLVLLRSALLVALRHLLEASAPSGYSPADLVPLLALVPSLSDEAALLATAPIRKLRAALTSRQKVWDRRDGNTERALKALATATRRNAEGGTSSSSPIAMMIPILATDSASSNPATTTVGGKGAATTTNAANTTAQPLLPFAIGRRGNRPYRDVCADVAFYLAAHTATGLAADSDDSEGDVAEVVSPTVATTTAGTQQQQQQHDWLANLGMGDIATCALYGNNAAPIVDGRTPIAITPPTVRTTAWIREKCGIKGDGTHAGTTATGRVPLTLVRVATSATVYEDVLMHLSSMPVVTTTTCSPTATTGVSSSTHASATTAASNAATNPTAIAKLAFPLVTLLQHFMQQSTAILAAKAATNAHATATCTSAAARNAASAVAHGSTAVGNPSTVSTVPHQESPTSNSSLLSIDTNHGDGSNANCVGGDGPNRRLVM